MVAAREGTLAHLALKWSNARVLAVVSRQLVAACELPAAALPRAMVGLLARVYPHVRLQVRALRVRLDTARMWALVMHGAYQRHRRRCCRCRNHHHERRRRLRLGHFSRRLFSTRSSRLTRARLLGAFPFGRV